MQTNDLNKLLSQYGDSEGLKDIMFSNLNDSPELISKEEIQKLKETINPLFLQNVRSVVKEFENLGKSRRWIRRYVKRKFNITEY